VEEKKNVQKHRKMLIKMRMKKIYNLNQRFLKSVRKSSYNLVTKRNHIKNKYKEKNHINWQDYLQAAMFRKIK